MLWHSTYRDAGRAFVVKTNPPIKKLPDGRFKWAGKGPPDFFGVANGRAICFEAKDCTRRRWQFSGLQRHQAVALEAMQVNGGISFVALRFNGVAWYLPWSRLGPLWWDGKERGLSADGIRSIGIPMEADGWIECLP